MKSMEDEADAMPAVERTYATVGSRTVSGGLSLNTKAENLGQLNVVMADRSDHEAEAAMAERLRRSYAGMPDVGAS